MMIFKQHKPLILASGSPRRKGLLDSIGLEFTTQISDIDESVKNNEAPEDYVLRLSQEKTNLLAQQNPNSFILGADTTVVLNNKCVGKPESMEEARIILESLSDTEHYVISAFTLQCRAMELVHSEISKSFVHVKKLSDAFISSYINSGDPMDKAGAYGIQGVFASMISCIEGSYTNIIGFDLSAVSEALLRFEVIKYDES